MSELNFKKLENELDNLVFFMTNNDWNFHSNPKPSHEQIVKEYNNGWYQEDKDRSIYSK